MFRTPEREAVHVAWWDARIHRGCPLRQTHRRDPDVRRPVLQRGGPGAPRGRPEAPLSRPRRRRQSPRRDPGRSREPEVRRGGKEELGGIQGPSLAAARNCRVLDRVRDEAQGRGALAARLGGYALLPALAPRCLRRSVITDSTFVLGR